MAPLCFLSTPEDSRAKLTWRNRFKQRPAQTDYYNYYSSGEEVLRTHPHETVPGPTDIGMFNEAGKYAWTLQEKLKGRMWDIGIDILGSRYGGWGFNFEQYKRVAGQMVQQRRLWSPADTNDIVLNHLDQLRLMPFFKKGIQDTDLFTDAGGSSHAEQNKIRLLAEAIPSRTLPVGANVTSTFGEIEHNFNMNSTLFQQNGWPESRDTNNWLHSDIREMSYLYVYGVFNSFVDKGVLQ